MKTLTTAVLHNGAYWYFGICEKTCGLYGANPEDIVNVELEIAENQVKPQPNHHPLENDYWGWLPTDSDKFTLIYTQYVLMSICFAYGHEAEEKAGKGKPYRLIVRPTE